MTKKIIRFILLILIVLLSSSTSFADDPPPKSSKNGNFTAGKFNDNSAWSKGGKATDMAPDPTAANGANRMPISNGMWILLLGSTLFLSKRVYTESNRKKQL